MPEIVGRLSRKVPRVRLGAPAPASVDMQLLRAMVDFLFARDDRCATQREVLRRFSPRWKKADLEKLLRNRLLNLPVGKKMPILRAGRRYELSRTIGARGSVILSLRPPA